MKRQRVSTVLVMVCVLALSFALTACGGNAASSSSASSSDASASSSSAAADPAEKFVGTWKFAAAEMEGLTVTGDLSSIIGESFDITLTLKDGGAGSMTFGDEEANISWEMAGDDAITLAAADADEDFTGAGATYQDGVLALEMDDDEFTGAVYLTPDGTMEGATPIDMDKATDITSDAAIVGTWRLAGANMMGASMYGDADDLAAMIGEDDEGYSVLVINADGTATILGTDATWEVGSDGAVISIDGADIPLQMIGDDIAVNLGDIAGLDMVMLYAK